MRETDGHPSEVVASALPSPSEPFRALILTPAEVYSSGLAALLARSSRLQVVGTGITDHHALHRLDLSTVDVLVIDVTTPENRSLARSIHSLAPGIGLVGINLPDRDDAVIECAEAEIRGYVMSGGSADYFLDTVEGVALGEVRCSPRVAAVLVGRVAALAGGRVPPEVGLTSREHQILTCLNEGLSNKEIAKRLSIETATVKNHIHNLLQKLNVHHRREAAALAQITGGKA